MKMIFFLLVAVAFVEGNNCYEGMWEDVEGQCHECSEGCKGECQDKVGCPECDDRYRLVDGYCRLCETGCKTCENFELCLTCEEGYYHIMDNCKKIPDNCEKVKENKGCTKCEDGYFLTNKTNGYCITCGEGCDPKSCAADGTDGCKRVTDDPNDPKEYYIKNKQARACHEKCVVCYEPTKGDDKYGDDLPEDKTPGCARCESGYYVTEENGNQICGKCDSLCKECYGTATNCTECPIVTNEANTKVINYYRYEAGESDNKKIYSCRPRQPASICTKFVDDEKGFECETCAAGFFKKEGYCYPKHPMCEEEDTENGNQCKKCSNGLIPFEGTCIHKPENCKEYKEDGFCKDCEDLFYLVDGFCKRCDENCISCNPITGECLECLPNYYSNDTATCMVKSSDISGTSIIPLWSIGNNTHPHRCVDGDYVDYHSYNHTSRECKQCSEFCLEETIEIPSEDPNGEPTSIIKTYCDSHYGCTKCRKGFYVSVDGECSSCPVHCAYCDQTLGCLHCLGDAKMDHGRCPYSGASSVVTLLIVLILAFAI